VGETLAAAAYQIAVGGRADTNTGCASQHQ
jgi:hypothetical protein